MHFSRRGFFFGTFGLATASFLPTQALGKREPIHNEFSPNVLMMNESVVGPSREAMLAISGRNNRLDSYGYHELQLRALRMRIARDTGLPSDFVCLSAGSQAAIHDLVAALAEKRQLVVTEPEYREPALRARACKLRVSQSSPDSNFSVDLRALRCAIEVPSIVYISNPQLPLGRFVARQQLENFLTELPKDAFLVLDECYIQFLGKDYSGKSAANLVTKFSNLAVLRTFSKIYGLASLRVGYFLLHPDTQRRYLPLLWKSERHVAADSALAARAALDDTAHLEAAWRETDKRRDEMADFALRNKIRMMDGRTNFVTFLVGRRMDLQKIDQEMRPYLVSRGHLRQDTYIRAALKDRRALDFFKTKIEKILQTPNRVEATV